MARYTAADCKRCRREKMKLFLKGDRCFKEKCAVERRNWVIDRMVENGFVTKEDGEKAKNGPVPA